MPTKQYTTANLSLDSVAAVYGGSNLLSTGGLVYLNYNRPAVDANHIMYSRYDEGSGTTATDDSSNANNGTLTGPDLMYELSFGGHGAARFNSPGVTSQNTTEYIDAGIVLQYEYTQPWSCWAVVKQENLPLAGSAAIIFTDVGGSPYPGYELWVTPSGVLCVRIIHNITATYIEVVGSTNIVDNGVHVVGASYDGSGLASGVKLYVDGAAETLTTNKDTLAGNTIVSGSNFWVGNQSGFAYSFNGSIGPFKLFNIAQSAAWFAAHASGATIPAVDANTVLSYLFDETSGTTVYDGSSNAFNGTVHSAAATVLTAFKVGTNALYFDGYSGAGGAHYVTYPHLAAYNLGSTFTIFSWAESPVAPANMPLIDHANPSSPYEGWVFSDEASDVAFYAGNGVSWNDSTVAFTTGWHVYALRWNSGTLDFWIDGTKVKTLTGIAAITAFTVALAIGYRSSFGQWQGHVSNTHLSNTNRADAYIQQFSTAHPATGIASLTAPGTAIASGGGDYGSAQTFSSVAATVHVPTTTTLEIQVGASSTSGAAAITAAAAATWQSLASGSATLTSVVGRYLAFNLRLKPSTDTLARDTPTISDLTFTYTSAGTTAPVALAVSGAGRSALAPGVSFGVREAVAGAGATTIALKPIDGVVLGVAGQGRTALAAGVQYGVAARVSGSGATALALGASFAVREAVAGQGRTSIAPGLSMGVTVAVGGAGRTSAAVGLSYGVAAAIAGAGRTALSVGVAYALAVAVAGQGRTTLTMGNGQTFALALAIAGQGRTALSPGVSYGIALGVAGAGKSAAAVGLAYGVAFGVGGRGRTAATIGFAAGVRIAVTGMGAVHIGASLGLPLPKFPVRATLSVAPGYTATLSVTPAYTATLDVENED